MALKEGGRARERELKHKFLRPRREGAGKPPALVLLHGRGADEDDLLGLAEYFDDRLFVLSPRAPFPFAHGGGYTWYDLEEIGRPDAAMFRESHGLLSEFLRAAPERFGVDPARIYCCGFSMGSVMALASVLAAPASLAGVMANSGYLPEDAALNPRWEGIRGKPFFVAHGRYDPVIPYAYGTRIREVLSEHGADVTYREYDMGHQINEESLGDMIGWLAARLGA